MIAVERPFALIRCEDRPHENHIQASVDGVLPRWKSFAQLLSSGIRSGCRIEDVPLTGGCENTSKDASDGRGSFVEAGDPVEAARRAVRHTIGQV